MTLTIIIYIIEYNITSCWEKRDVMCLTDNCSRKNKNTYPKNLQDQ